METEEDFVNKLLTIKNPIEFMKTFDDQLRGYSIDLQKYPKIGEKWIWANRLIDVYTFGKYMDKAR